jgi:Putative esterase
MNTGMMGSSMGGLITLYAGLKYASIFGKLAPLSSSFWFSPSVYDYAGSKQYNAVDQKMYMIAGGKEGGSQVSDMYKMRDLLSANGYDDTKLKAIDHPQEGHNEAYWAGQFESIFTWLFNSPTATNEIVSKAKYGFVQDSNTIYYKGEVCKECKVYIVNIVGQIVYCDVLQEGWHVNKNGLIGLNKVAIEQNNKIVYSQMVCTY